MTHNSMSDWITVCRTDRPALDQEIIEQTEHQGQRCWQCFPQTPTALIPFNEGFVTAPRHTALMNIDQLLNVESH